MDIYKVPLLEELVNRIRYQRSHPESRLEQIGPGTKMRNGPQVLHGMSLLLHRVVRCGCTFQDHLLCLDLERLLGIRCGNQFTRHDHGRADIELADIPEILQLV